MSVNENLDSSKLIWSQHFDVQKSVDPNVWSYEIGDGSAQGIPGWGNNELQIYVDSNAIVEGNDLVILVRKTNEEAPEIRIPAYKGSAQFTSARLISKNKVHVLYGKIEIRAKVPSGKGLWPAFWLLGDSISEVGWPKAGEIDVMEWIGREPLRVFGTIHGPDRCGSNGFGGATCAATPLYESFHVFRIDWRESEIVWYLDDIEYHRASPSDIAPCEWVYNHPFFFILNVAVGGNLGGEVDSNLPADSKLLVEWIKVSKLDDDVGEIIYIA